LYRELVHKLKTKYKKIAGKGENQKDKTQPWHLETDQLTNRHPNHKVRIPYIDEVFDMLAKMTAKNQLTLPKSVTTAVGAGEYFEIEVRNGQIVLTPVRIQRADAVRAKLAELDLGERDIMDAVTWARQPVKGSATE